MKAIVAIDKLWGIGKDGKLLFRIKEDMKFFKKMTTNKVVVMGRKTFESLPNKEPLKDRINLVITSDKSYQSHDNVIFGDIDKINEEINKYDTNDIFIIGGASIYKQFIHRCDSVYVTHNINIYEADTYMPNLAFEGFVFKEILYRSDDNSWVIEEWGTSELKSYKSVIWFNDSNNETVFLYTTSLSHWKTVYSNKFRIITNDFKNILKSIISYPIKEYELIKINSYYRAGFIVYKNGNILLRLASFGATENEARQNLVATVVNLLA